MLAVLREVATKSYSSKAELVVAVNAALTSWAQAYSLTITPFIAADFPDTVTVSTVAHLIGRKLLGIPAMSYQKRDGSVVSLSSFTALVTAFETDYNGDPSGSYFYYGGFDTLKDIASRLDSFLTGSAGAFLASAERRIPLKDRQCDVYSRPAIDPKLEHITWLNGLFDWRLLYRIAGTTLTAYQNMGAIAGDVAKAAELTLGYLDTDVTAYDLFEFLMRNVREAAKKSYSYSVTKNAYVAGDGTYVNSSGYESVLNRLLSMRHPGSLYPIVFF